ncbi:hypothetical protein B566_EDAN013343 [Ephemera danica]|nr:hypothetical protein B566_EDAN013343 [Ephemera danica]
MNLLPRVEILKFYKESCIQIIYINDKKKCHSIPSFVKYNDKIADSSKKACNLFSEFFTSVFGPKENNITLNSKTNINVRKPLEIIYNIIFLTGVFPNKWKIAHVTPIHKLGKKRRFRIIYLYHCSPFFSKLLEKFIYKKLWEETKNLIPPKQHGFTPKKSTDTKLVEFHTCLATAINDKKQVDAVYTDFKNAFDRVSHTLLIKKN